MKLIRLTEDQLAHLENKIIDEMTVIRFELDEVPEGDDLEGYTEPDYEFVRDILSALRDVE